MNPLQFNPVRLISQAEGRAAALENQRLDQGNALIRAQAQRIQQEQAEKAQQQNALMQFRQSLPSPQMIAAQRGLAGGGGPTQANAARMPAVDPRLQMLYQYMQAGGDPMKYASEAYPEPTAPKFMTVGKTVLRQGADGVEPVYTEPAEAKADPFDDQLRGVGIDPASPEGMALKRKRIDKAVSHAPAASAKVVLPPQQSKFVEEQGKQFSEVMGGINKAGYDAPIQIRKLERMEQLLRDVDGGKLAPLGLEVASWANSVGIKMDPRLGNKEAAQALARDIAAGFRVPGTGPMTDKDFENFLLQVPDLSKSAEGRAEITKTMRAAANRNIALAKMARAYVRDHGELNDGFLEEAAMFMAENPVVGDPVGWKVMR